MLVFGRKTYEKDIAMVEQSDEEPKRIVGRPPAKPKGEQLEVYLQHKNYLLKPDRTLKPRTAQIFEKLGTELHMTSSAVHRSISVQMTDIFGIDNYVQKSQTNEKTTDDDVDFVYRETNGYTVILKIPDDYKKYFDVAEEERGNRTYKKIREGWTDKLFELIVKQTSTDCVLNFTNTQITKGAGDTYDFEVKATCSECKGIMKISSTSNRTSLNTFFTAGPNEHTHTKMRRITAARANDVFKQLQNDTVCNVFHKQTEDIPYDADHLPRDFMTYKNIENIKTRHSQMNSSALNELRRMKHSAEFDNAIKEIGVEPFVVHFWTKAQVHFYSQIAAGKGKASISLDATGSMISNKSLLTDIQASLERDFRLPHVFLYLISVKNHDGASVPVGQMLSAQQDSTRIAYFLKRWLESFKRPAEAVMDDSKALLKSCAESFTSCENINDYIRKCYAVLNGEHDQLPKCYLRLDIAHFVKNLHKIEIIRKMGPIAKQFYLSCFGVIIQCENFDSIIEIAKNMVNLANGAPECEKSQKCLSNLIQSHKIEFMSEHNVADDPRSKRDSFLEESSDDNEISWFDKAVDKAKEKIVNEESVIEPYFQPKLNRVFKDLFDRLPLWSAVMKPFFDSNYNIATSNDTESRFNVLKSVVFKNYTFPMRPDIFAQVLIRYVESVAKLASITNAQHVIRKIYRNL